MLTRNCELRISDFGLARELPKDAEASAEARQDGNGMTEVTERERGEGGGDTTGPV